MNRIENILTSIGYERQLEKTDDFKIKWVQCIQSINWNVFKDGEQLVNHIQGEDYFTTKVQLYQSLKSYEKMSMTMQKRSSQFLPLDQFVPQTFKLDEKHDRDAFFNAHQRLSILFLFSAFPFDSKILFSWRRLDLQTKWT